MDIVRAFEASSLATGISINIQGTPEDPLFQANQIGKLLEISNIRDTIRDFDEDEYRVGTTDTINLGTRTTGATKRLAYGPM